MRPTDDHSPHQRLFSPYRQQRDLVEPRHSVPDRGNLRTFDVFALIVNKMIGTGIYTTPATVFLMTGNKALTLGLFVAGFLYAVVSMAIYLDYAKVLPFNGGELIYFEEITCVVTRNSISPPSDAGNPDEIEMRDCNPQRLENQPSSNTVTGSANRFNIWATRMCLLLGDGLWAFILYSIAFIVFFNSGSNSLQFGRMILLCLDDEASTSSTSPGDNNQDQGKALHKINQDVMRLIGVNVLTLICLLQYFSPSFGRSMNKTLAVIKLLSLFGLILVAGTAESASDDWRVWHPTEGEQRDNANIGKPASLAFGKALLAVLFSFQGWENATFVVGEMPSGKHKILRRGFIAAVFTVGVFYLVIVTLFLRAITWKDVSDGHENVNYPPMLTKGGAKARQAWAIVAAISSFGSLNAIIYTFSRVKQVIGQAEILPWSRYLRMDDILQRSLSKPAEDAQDEDGGAGDEALDDIPLVVNHALQRACSERAEDESLDESSQADEVPQLVQSATDEFWHKAPQGGLIAHWLMSVIAISASAASPTTLEAAGLPGYFQTYVHCFFQAILGIGFPYLKARHEALRPDIAKPSESWCKPSHRLLLSLGIPIYIALNAAILVINAVGPYKGTDGSAAAFKGYGFPIMLGGLLIIGTAYYLVFFGAASRRYESSANPQPGVLSKKSRFNLMKQANVQCEIRKDYTHNDELERVYRSGRRWILVYFLPGDGGYESSGQTSDGVASGQTSHGVTLPMFLYWLFGGSRLKPDWNPANLTVEEWRSFKGEFHSKAKEWKTSIEGFFQSNRGRQ